MGKIGLPLAVYLARNNQVIGLDNNLETVNQVNAGQEPFPGEKNLQEQLTQVVVLGRISTRFGWICSPHPLQYFDITIII